MSRTINEENSVAGDLAANRPGWKSSEAIVTYLMVIGAFALLFLRPEDASVRDLAEKILLVMGAGFVASRTGVKMMGDSAQAKIVVAQEGTQAEAVASKYAADVEMAKVLRQDEFRVSSLEESSQPGGVFASDDVLDLPPVPEAATTTATASK